MPGDPGARLIHYGLIPSPGVFHNEGSSALKPHPLHYWNYCIKVTQTVASVRQTERSGAITAIKSRDAAFGVNLAERYLELFFV